MRHDTLFAPLSCIGIDTGASVTRIWDGQSPVEQHATPPELDDYIELLSDRLRSRPLTSVAIAVPAVVRSNVIVAGSNLRPSWFRTDVRDRISQALGDVAVSILQDTEAAGFAAARTDAAGAASALLLTISTGLGGAWLTGDIVKPLEIGHMPLDLSGERNVCGCTQVGCVEADLSGTAIAKRTSTPAEALQDDEFWKRYGREFGAFLAVSAPLFAAETVVLMGGVSNQLERFLPSLLDVLNERVRHIDVPNIVATQLGDDIGVVGAYEVAVKL